PTAGQPPATQPFPGQPPQASQPMNWAVPGPAIAGSPAPPGTITSDDRSMAMLIHLLSLVAGFIGPLIVWLIKRDQSAFIDYHGKEALNFQISMFIYWIVALLAMIILIGFLLIPVLLVLQLLFPILAAVAANKGEYYRYPLSIRLIS
ncbi:MAG: DUF4870 domain-containing protein, partial [Acidimicrobiales bacterium]